MRGYGDVLDDFCPDCNSATDLVGMSLVYAAMLVPSLAVDFATGSMFELSPSRIVHDLQ